MKNIYLQLLEKQDEKMPVLATVCRTKGSTPQKPGSSALFNDAGLIAGTVGGGIVEGEIQKFAAERFFSGESGYFEFNLDNDISKKEAAICGGQISILIDAGIDRHKEVFRQLQNSISENTPGVLVTTVTVGKGKKVVIDRYWMNGVNKPDIPENILERVQSKVMSMIETADPTTFCEIEIAVPGEEQSTLVFLEPVFPPLRLIIAGAGHIGKALSHIGSRLGFEVTVTDDRSEYANHENLPDAGNVLVKDIGEVMNEIRKGPDTYIVIVTRGHKDDAMALRACLGSDVAYLGMIGSKRKIESMRGEFMEKGFVTAEQWARIYTPIGLDINALTVEEIAVSIAAQIIMVKNSRKKKSTSCPA